MIEIDCIDIELPDFNWDLVEIWLEKVIEEHGKEIGELTYFFCSDEKILEVNRESLDHNYYTDIITFDFVVADIISGEMYISLDTVRTNAIQFNSDYNEELLRVMVHGVLHLCGFKDKSDDDAGVMRLKENEALRIYNTL